MALSAIFDCKGNCLEKHGPPNMLRLIIFIFPFQLNIADNAIKF